jgi:hypothetical protein
LTAILEKTGSKTVLLSDGRRISGKRLLAVLLWQGVTTGCIILPDGAKYELGPSDWLALVKTIYSQVDGSPPQQLQHTGAEGGPIQVESLPPSEIAARVAALMAVKSSENEPD